MNAAPIHDFDVIIAGGGLAGLSLGLALAQGGVRVAAVDAIAPPVSVAPPFDGRVSALAPTSRRMFEAMGLWSDMAPEAQPVRDIVVSDGTVRDGASPLFLHFETVSTDEPLSHMIENRHVRIAQQAALACAPSLTLLAPERVTRVSFTPGAAEAHLASGRVLRAALCVAAEGRASPLRAQMGIKTIGWDYAQHGIVTTVEHERPHEGAAQELFLPSGPFAILPMRGNRSSLVWTERADVAPAIMALDDASFAGEVRARFTDFLGAVRPVGPRWSYPLSLHLAREYVRPRFALLGDSAHGIHPLAGQGLNLGLRDAAALAEIVIDAMRLGQDIGATSVLAQYEQWRRFDNTLFALGCDALNTIFSNDIPPLRAARDAGMGLINLLKPLKRTLVTQAAGDAGRLPKLLRAEAI